METESPFRFIFYILFIAVILGSLYSMRGVIVDQQPSITHQASKAHGENDPKSSNAEASHQSEKSKAAENIEDRKPMFKQQIQIKPIAKEALNQEKLSSVSAQVEEQSPLGNDQTEVENITETKTQKIESSQGSADYFEQLKSNYDEQVLSKIKTGDVRRDIIIRYYTHPADQDKIYTLKDLGFYIHERPVEGSLIGYESNAVFYGDDVRKEELQLVVYYLLKEGMPIKRIAKSQFHDGWKSSSIEIGTDTTVTKEKILTKDDLLKLSF